MTRVVGARCTRPPAHAFSRRLLPGGRVVSCVAAGFRVLWSPAFGRGALHAPSYSRFLRTVPIRAGGLLCSGGLPRSLVSGVWSPMTLIGPVLCTGKPASLCCQRNPAAVYSGTGTLARAGGQMSGGTGIRRRRTRACSAR